MIRIYNTLSRTKEVFETVRPGKVGIYLCGPTVYKPSHIGHMVGPVIFDTIKRYLSYNGYEVTWVVNITDVDDKLIARSRELGIPMAQLAEQMTADYMECLRVIGVDGIDHFPRATDHIPDMLQFIEDLIRKGFAYDADGDVYFDVSKASHYGQLSRRSLESVQGEGGEGIERKRSVVDFALWKRSKPGEPSWPSPWGPGRPGWHIECSVMSARLLGETFDIHGGGLDLIFPHHENEIAQSESRHGKPMARYWVHNGLMQDAQAVVKVGGRMGRATEDDAQAQEAGKIAGRHGAKSFLLLLQEEKLIPEVVRFFILATHYRRPIEFSVERIREVGAAVEGFYRFFRSFSRITGEDAYRLPTPTRRQQGELSPCDNALLRDVAELRRRFLEAMDDDFNTGAALGYLFDLLRRINKYIDDQRLEEPAVRTDESLRALRQATITLRELGGIFGVFRKPVEMPSLAADNLVGKLVQLLIDVRTDARKKKDFATADAIRNGLSQLGIQLEDRPSGTEWSFSD